MLPETFHTARLKLRPIVPEDAGPIFDGYAQDTTVTRFVIWRPHRSRSDTEAYIAQCIATPPDVSRTYVLTDRTNGDVRVAPCKRVELTCLRWQPRQSLASSRVPSLAWRPVTAAAKRRLRRQGGCRPEHQ